MNRRAFLSIVGGMLVGSLPFPDALATNPVWHPLLSRPDAGTQLNPEKASKARKLASYAITEEEHEGIIVHHPLYVPDWWKKSKSPAYFGLQIVQVGIRMQGWIYDVKVYNDVKRRGGLGNDMEILYGPDDPNIQKTLKFIYLQDHGLDGRCDQGQLGPGLNNGVGLEFNTLGKRGLQHRDRFQALYEEVLDKLIRFYEH